MALDTVTSYWVNYGFLDRGESAIVRLNCQLFHNPTSASLNRQYRLLVNFVPINLAYYISCMLPFWDENLKKSDYDFFLKYNESEKL